MRALVIRFIDCEGPGIIEPLLREKGYRVSYHNAYDTRVSLMPEAHITFPLILLLGGPNSIQNNGEDPLLLPYLQLVKNALAVRSSKIIGICLGGQIISRALGAEVKKGDKGPELGFAPMKIIDTQDEVFRGINSNELMGFHLHEDVFSIPPGAKHLLSTDMYPNQMYSYENRVFAFQAHIEATLPMLGVWKEVHKEFLKQGKPDLDHLEEKQKQMEESGKIIFRNILNL
ncbi:putative glutamine amidotransferase, class-I [Leptospira ryugenii]|uniref:Putative glutamine amidotransferase, class-I n=1 Tax=Leptospira ryugenii TaxID=1917863 RepID=A0A2P2E4K3_9LEPT|nr:type 1 glutamine amidotransferase [Leptospira ryugenii]GBF51784.1 putative glutamine amidotransferase, class-I [Leptospira ryugenii]